MTDENNNNVTDDAAAPTGAEGGVAGLDIDSMSDEEFAKLDPADLFGEGSQTAAGDPSGDESAAQVSDGTSEQAGDGGDAGGAAAPATTSEEDPAGEATTSAEHEDVSGRSDPHGAAADTEPLGDQPTGEDSAGGGEDPNDDAFDYKAEYEKLMSPLKAAKRTITPDNVDDVRRLMQKGVDYERKMEGMKPYRQILKTLEKADLLDQDKINFLLDVQSGNPEAVKQLLKDTSIDPMDIDLRDSAAYSPTDHAPAESEMALTDVLESIKDTETFEKTVDATTALDQRSMQALRDNPELLVDINNHMASGVYDQVMDKVSSERLFGRLTGLSDLEAYYQVGMALQQEIAAKEAANPGSTQAPAGDTKPGSAQNQGSSGKPGGDNEGRKRAAGSPRGGAPSGKKPAPNFAEMSDDEFAKQKLSSFLS